MPVVRVCGIPSGRPVLVEGYAVPAGGDHTITSGGNSRFIDGAWQRAKHISLVLAFRSSASGESGHPTTIVCRSNGSSSLIARKLWSIKSWTNRSALAKTFRRLGPRVLRASNQISSLERFVECAVESCRSSGGGSNALGLGFFSEVMFFFVYMKRETISRDPRSPGLSALAGLSVANQLRKRADNVRRNFII